MGPGEEVLNLIREANEEADRRDAFVAALVERLDHGAREYGQRSFQREPADLAGELEQEALDIAGWGYILWCRIRALKERL